MARKIDIGIEFGAVLPSPVFLITSNEGTAEETVVQHIYAPTTSTQRTALYADGIPIGSTTNDVTSGKAFVVGAAAWEAVTSV